MRWLTAINAFETSIEKIIVPKSAINAYKTAEGWSVYADKIVYEVDSSDLDAAVTYADNLNARYVSTSILGG